jgi:hypothetical protein
VYFVLLFLEKLVYFVLLFLEKLVYFVLLFLKKLVYVVLLFLEKLVNFVLQETTSVLSNQEVHYRVHKTPPLVPVLLLCNSNRRPPIVLKIRCNVFVLSALGLQNGSLSLCFPIKIVRI